MNKRLIITGFLILIAATVLKLVYIGLSNLEIDDFHPAAVIFVIDSSASNQQKLDEQKSFVSQACKRLDPEDQVKIIRVSEDAYLIYEGSALSSRNIRKSLEAFTRYDASEWGTAYGVGLNKAMLYAQSMFDEGYIPAIIVVGDLENEGKQDKQIDWNKLPKQVKALKTNVENFAMMFVYAHPQKLDMVKTKLNPVLGESNLVISTEENLDKSLSRFLKAIGR